MARVGLWLRRAGSYVVLAFVVVATILAGTLGGEDAGRREITPTPAAQAPGPTATPRAQPTVVAVAIYYGAA